MSVGHKILLVDDEARVRALFRRALAGAGYHILECENGVEALVRIEQERPALVVLDVNMPQMNGWQTLTELRRRGSKQLVLMMTELNDLDSRVHGLDRGADDYMGKPFQASELRARVRALLRRAPAALASPDPLRFGNLVVDLEGKSAHRGSQPVRLTRTEYALLELFQRHAGRPVSREVILETMWGTRSGNSNTVATHLWRLRKKLGGASDQDRWIKNLAGIGYVMKDDTMLSSEGGALI